MTAYDPDWQRAVHSYMASAQSNLDRPFDRPLDRPLFDPERSVGAWAVSRPSPAPAWRSDAGPGPPPSLESHSYGDVVAQLQAVMAEMADMRRLQQAEQEGRAAALQFLGKKLREETEAQVAALEMRLQRTVAEAEVGLKQRAAEAEQARAQERQRQDALLRSMKLQDRQYRDVVEALKADMTELHGKVDGSVATMKQYRIELAQALDHERGVQVQRFDAEMQRYEERARQRDSNLAEVRNAVTKEMMDVQRVARDYVRQVWEERSEALNKHVNDKLVSLKQAQDMQTGIIVDIGNKMLATRDELKVELGEGVRDLKVRLHKMEVETPTLAARMDRFDRKSDILTDRVTSLDQGLDAVKAAEEKTSSQAAKLNERLTLVEQLTVDLETRMAKLERASAVLQHVEANRQAIGTLRKDVERITFAMQALRDIVAQGEASVEGMRRTADIVCDRADAMEKKAAKLSGRFEACEQKVGAFHDRLTHAEQAVDGLQHAADHADAGLRELTQGLEKQGRKAQVLLEKVDAVDNAWRNKTQQYDQRFDRLQDSQCNIDASLAIVTSALERGDRRLSVLDATVTRCYDQVTAVSQQFEAARKEVGEVERRMTAHGERLTRTEAAVDGKQEAVDKVVNTVLEKVELADRRLAAAVQATEGKLGDRLEQLDTAVQGLGEAAKERGRQGALTNERLARVEGQLLAELKEVRSRVEKERAHLDELLRGNEASLRALQERSDAAEKQLGALQSRLTVTAGGLATLQDSDAVPALRGRLEEAERLVRQLQAAQQAAGQRLQECQAAQLGRADVVAIVEDVGKRQRDEISRLAEVSGAVEAAAKQAKAAEARAREVREELEAAVQAQRRGDGRLAQVGDLAEGTAVQLKLLKDRLGAAETSRAWDVPLSAIQSRLEMAEKALQTRLEGLERELTSVVTRLQALALGKLPATIAVPVPISPYPAPASPLGHHAGFGTTATALSFGAPPESTTTPPEAAAADPTGVVPPEGPQAAKGQDRRAPPPKATSHSAPAVPTPDPGPLARRPAAPPPPPATPAPAPTSDFDEDTGSSGGGGGPRPDAAAPPGRRGSASRRSSGSRRGSVQSAASSSGPGEALPREVPPPRAAVLGEGCGGPAAVPGRRASSKFDSDESEAVDADDANKHKPAVLGVSIPAKKASDKFDTDSDVGDILEDSDDAKKKKKEPAAKAAAPPAKKASDKFDTDSDVGDILEDSDDAKKEKKEPAAKAAAPPPRPARAVLSEDDSSLADLLAAVRDRDRAPKPGALSTARDTEDDSDLGSLDLSALSDARRPTPAAAPAAEPGGAGRRKPQALTMLGSPPAEAGARPGRARPAVQWSDSDSDRAPPQPPPHAGRREAVTAYRGGGGSRK